MSKYRSFNEIGKNIGRTVPQIDRPIVCVQGLGFVGAAMAVAVANSCDPRGLPYFNVIGVDLPTTEGLAKIESINAGRFPFSNSDRKLAGAMEKAHSIGNIIATADPLVYSSAKTIIVDVNFDLTLENSRQTFGIDDFRAAIKTLGKFLKPGCLVIVETTVPPGTCEKIVAPELSNTFKRRGLPEDSFLLAHSYERVMPGEKYLDSIVNYWRVYAGHTPQAADACEAFLSKIIDINSYPLTRLSSTTASEVGKVLENSYRAVTIAFMEEWGRFAEAIGVDLFEVISAIRKRPTHSNMRHPGFGVGGYCLPKDPLLAINAAHELFGLHGMEFPFCSLAVPTNRTMPLVSLKKVQDILGGKLSGKSILLLGVSYLQDIGDTRFSPSLVFVENARLSGAHVRWHDPFIDYWPELDETSSTRLPRFDDVDAVVLAVPHKEYKDLDFTAYLNDSRPLFFDANNVLNKKQRASLRTAGCKVMCIGRGNEV